MAPGDRPVPVAERLFVRLWAQPFDKPFHRDPLFRWGLALSMLASVAVLVAEIALGDWTKGVLGALVLVLLVPVGVNQLIFGAVGGCIRAFRRGWSEQR